MGLPLIGLVVHAASSGIGLAAEVVAAKKKSNRSTNQSSPDPLSDSSSTSELDNEELPPYTESNVTNACLPIFEKAPENYEEIVHVHECAISTSISSDAPTTLEKSRGLHARPTLENFASALFSQFNPPPLRSTRLSRPVILPQRRPGSNDRGFIRAYAPALAEHGISRDAFLSFLKTFDEASKASSALNVLYLSGKTILFLPSQITAIPSIPLELTAGMAIEFQKRERTKCFLDKTNEKLFKPRGLHAFIASSSPEASKSGSREHRGSADTASWKAGGPRRIASNDSYRELDLPEAAELVFPQQVAQMTDDMEEQAGWLKRNQKHLADYYDRRAQAAYASRFPGSSLTLSAGKMPAFASSFGDPGHSANAGSLVGLVRPNHKRTIREGGQRQSRIMQRYSLELGCGQKLLLDES